MSGSVTHVGQLSAQSLANVQDGIRLKQMLMMQTHIICPPS